MYVLNLADHNRSSIDYEFYKYPDGQQQINLKGLKVIIGEEGFPENFDKEPIIIKSRLNGFMDARIELIFDTFPLKIYSEAFSFGV